jgi:uncharacterized membrane protein
MKKVAWIIVVVLAIFIAIFSPTVFILYPKVGILALKTKALLSDMLYMSSFYIHVVLGGIALLIGWVGFSDVIRKKHLKWHRILGKVYIICFSITAFTSILVSYHAYGGIISQLGFMTVGIIALFTTIKGYKAIRQKDIAKHQMWMRYSYACCLASVSLRIWMPMSSLFITNNLLAYQIVSWFAWVPNLGIAYFINKSKQGRLAFQKV